MLFYREHLLRIVTPSVPWRLLALFTPNSREGFPKIGVNALGITKGVIKDRFHLYLEAVTNMRMPHARCVPGSYKPRRFSELGNS
jgi:hypothetical protein